MLYFASLDLLGSVIFCNKERPLSCPKFINLCLEILTSLVKHKTHMLKSLRILTWLKHIWSPQANVVSTFPEDSLLKKGYASGHHGSDLPRWTEHLMTSSPQHVSVIFQFDRFCFSVLRMYHCTCGLGIWWVNDGKRVLMSLGRISYYYWCRYN